MSLGGLIGAALKGGGEGYATAAKSEMEQQQKLDYAKQIAELQTQKELLIDAEKRKRNIADIEPTAKATANANLAVAPTNAAAAVATRKGTAQGLLDSNVPGLEAEVGQREFDANKQLNTDKAVQGGKDAAAGQVAKTNTPGYTSSVASESEAKSAGQIKAAEIGAAPHWAQLKRPSIQTDGDGNYFALSWDPKTNKTTAAPITGADGKPLKGPKDLDSRTKMLVEAELADIKSDLDPDSRAQKIQNVRDLLSGKTSASGGPSADDPLGLRSGTSAASSAVPGRPYYNTPLADLQRMATKPRGVSSDEANAARAEINARKGESRMSAY